MNLDRRIIQLRNDLSISTKEHVQRSTMKDFVVELKTRILKGILLSKKQRK